MAGKQQVMRKFEFQYSSSLKNELYVSNQNIT